MSGWSRHTGKIAVYDSDQVDTDRIIPARFLTMVTKTGYGELLFADVRGPKFPLDQPEALGASVLVVGSNFGCGSSREHAVWAIQQAGFVTVISKRTEDSPGFSDIFRQNASNCGLLLIELEPADQEILANAGSGATVSIDLTDQTIELNGVEIKFEITSGAKRQIMEGLDLIGTTMEHSAAIDKFEAKSKTYVPAPMQEPSGVFKTS